MHGILALESILIDMSDSIFSAKVFETLSEADYAALPYLSASTIRAALKYGHEQTAAIFAKSSFDDPHALGRWIHRLLLENLDVEPEHLPDCPQHLYPMLREAQKALNQNEMVKQIILKSKKEVTLVWKDPLSECCAKARLDMLHPEGIWDLKCIRGGFEVTSFDKKIKRMAWSIQAWWYQRAVSKVMGQQLPVGFMVLDTLNWSFRTQLLSQQELEKASNQARESMRKLKRWNII